MSLSILFPFVLGGLATAALSFVLMRRVAHLGWMDVPVGRKTHQAPTPLTGGMALFLALGAFWTVGLVKLPLTPIQVGGIAAMALLGCLDDRFDLKSSHKAIIGLSVAALLAGEMALPLVRAGKAIPLAGLPIPAWFPLVFALLVLWHWSIPQAVNLVDGVHGLSLGIVSLFLLASGMMGFGPGTAALWGALAGVMVLNFPKAFHFLGDCGALGLGTLSSILVMKRAVQGDAALALWIAAYLAIDVTRVVVIRSLGRRPLGQGDRNHLHHWAMDALKGRAWLVTPLLVALAALPMLRVLEGRAWDLLALLGVALLGVLTMKHILVRLLPAQRKAEPAAAPATALSQRVILGAHHHAAGPTYPPQPRNHAAARILHQETRTH